MMIGLLAGLVLSAGAALGQDGYEAPEIETRVPVSAIGYALVFLLGIAVVGFKNARRTHLD